jgi:hypothetical protein
MNDAHRAVVRVVVRIIGHEMPIGNAQIGGACNGPELAKAQTSGCAFACDLDCAENLDALGGFTMAVGNDDSVPAVVVEFKDQTLVDRAADRMHPGSVAKREAGAHPAWPR